uniref:Uncharacterized protein n=1 Tax=Arundo donax TaxID=35708 RepID=A0A0A9C2T7_ARUDO
MCVIRIIVFAMQIENWICHIRVHDQFPLITISKDDR